VAGRRKEFVEKTILNGKRGTNGTHVILRDTNNGHLSDKAKSLQNEQYREEIYMSVKAKYVHTNIVAMDYRKLSNFYIKVFGCCPVPPERDHYGEWVERATGVKNAQIKGIHLRLPGFGDAGPTLEIFQYSHAAGHTAKRINRAGFAHVAFSVEDIKSALEIVKSEGGGQVGELVTIDIPDAGRIAFVYVTDPEGNIIELQKWS
jgi:predicted enzyme related to lactoylglutathione lyase